MISATNDSSSTNLGQMLSQARAGDKDCLGRLLESYQNYLKLLASTQLDQKVRGRVSPSDVVQETMLEAHCDFPKFRGNSDGEFFSWLRRILLNNLSRAVEKHILAAKRDVRREVSMMRMSASLDRSATRLEAILADSQRSPESEITTGEQLIRLADALAELSPDHREVIMMRHLQGVAFTEIAEKMNRTNGATRMLWLRAIEQLRRLMSQGAGE